jgi:hypothetical protein
MTFNMRLNAIKVVVAMLVLSVLLITAGPRNALAQDQTSPAAPGAASQPVTSAQNPVTGATANPQVSGQSGPQGPVVDADGTSATGNFKLVVMAEGLFAALILAIVLEQALALLFNWRPFILVFDGRGVKSLVSLGLALVVVCAVNRLDLLQIFQNAMSGPVERPVEKGSWTGILITALVVAGGSAGINNILVSLGFRSATRAEEVRPKPPREYAWLSVRLLRKAESGTAPVRVMLSKDGEPYQLIGMIDGIRSPQGFLRWLLRDRTRFPTAAGHAVEGDHRYSVMLEGSDVPSAVPIGTYADPVGPNGWGPYFIAKGAIIDIVLST